jgi:hypothetical protein
MENEFDKHLETLKKAKELSQGTMDNLNNALDSLVPTDEFADALNSIPSPPTMGDSAMMEDIQNMIASCTWLGDSTKFSDPNKLLKGIMGAVVGAAKGLIDALNLPEINAAMLMDKLKELFGVNGLNLKAIVEAMDKILDCLSSVCNRDTSSRVSQMQDLMDDLRLTDSGELDSNGIYEDKGITGSALENLQGAEEKILSTQSSIESQIKGIKIPGL